MTEYIQPKLEPEPEPKPEQDDETDDETDDEDNMVLVGWKTYYKDSEGKLYDPDTHEEVGIYVDGKLVTV